jgi:hypothetical protein
MNRTFAAPIFALVLVAAPARADEMTAGDLQKICTASDDISKTECQYFIFGIAEGASLTSADPDAGTNKKHCIKIPDELTANAVVLAVKLKMGQDLMVFPADLTLPAVSVVDAVLLDAFPCTKKWH